MPVVVGFTFPMWHDNAAAAIVDGKLVFATEEERYTRHKHSGAEPPINALIETFRYLDRLGVKPTDIDAFALHFDSRLCPISARPAIFLYTAFYTAGYGFKPPFSSLAKATISLPVGNRTQVELARVFLRRVYGRMGIDLPGRIRIIPVVHHLAHAASAYYFSGFNSCAVITVDGYGEGESTVVWDVKGGEFERISNVRDNEGSIGLVYEAVSTKLGFEPLEGPGKVMGLAPYGKPNAELRQRFAAVGGPSEGNVPYSFSERFRRRASMYEDIADYVAKGLDLGWNPRQGPSQAPADLAFGLQEFTEELVLASANWARRQTGENKIALAGGVALNSKANMELYYSRAFDEVFVFPAANDAGSAIGAASYAYQNVLGGRMSHGELGDVYLGPGYDDDAVRKVVESSKWGAERVGDDTNQVASLVAHGAIVAWYQGRSEFGPRALGNRSLLADPSTKEMWRRLNEVKGREVWRPLAPSVLENEKDALFERPTNHRFMVMMFRMTKEGASKAPAVCHVDGTARPQVVSDAMNESLYQVIKAFGDTKGAGVVVNTSFNLAGEPLVQTPLEALRSFAVSGVDAIYMQGWLIRKPGVR